MHIHIYLQVFSHYPIYTGLGPKRAVTAIQNYKHIEGIIKHKEKIPGVRN